MKRWAICRMIENSDGQGSYGPVLDGYAGVSYRIWEHPTKQWCLAHLATLDLAPLNADSRIKILPDATLDAAWSTIPTAIRNQVKSAMGAAGFTWSVQNTWPVRQVLNYCVNQIQPGIDCTVGDVREPS